MTRNEQQMYRDISNLTKALEKLVKVLTKLAREQCQKNKKKSYLSC